METRPDPQHGDTGWTMKSIRLTLPGGAGLVAHSFVDLLACAAQLGEALDSLGIGPRQPEVKVDQATHGGKGAPWPAR